MARAKSVTGISNQLMAWVGVETGSSCERWEGYCAQPGRGGQLPQQTLAALRHGLSALTMTAVQMGVMTLGSGLLIVASAGWVTRPQD